MAAALADEGREWQLDGFCGTESGYVPRLSEARDQCMQQSNLEFSNLPSRASGISCIKVLQSLSFTLYLLSRHQLVVFNPS
mmetsp:Transcript_17239/g.39154  ORF Transcript_17239/g.39154 Transcript_17239/m.39154 type:complete len:81 (+) Transcript_17239:121-363(+)